MVPLWSSHEESKVFKDCADVPMIIPMGSMLLHTEVQKKIWKLCLEMKHAIELESVSLSIIVLPKGSKVVPFWGSIFILTPNKKIGPNQKGTTLEPLGIDK